MRVLEVQMESRSAGFSRTSATEDTQVLNLRGRIREQASTRSLRLAKREHWANYNQTVAMLPQRSQSAAAAGPCSSCRS